MGHSKEKFEARDRIYHITASRARRKETAAKTNKKSKKTDEDEE